MKAVKMGFWKVMNCNSSNKNKSQTLLVGQYMNNLKNTYWALRDCGGHFFFFKLVSDILLTKQEKTDTVIDSESPYP